MSLVAVSVTALEARAAAEPGYREAVFCHIVRVTDGKAIFRRIDYEKLKSQYGGTAPGPGAELKKLLAKFGIHASPTCGCNKMAARMNAWGPDESLNHIEEIVDVMEEEAKKRKLPFLRAAGRILVRKAIRNSRGNGS